MSNLTPHSTAFQMVGGDLSLDFANHMMRLKNYASTRDQFTILLSWLEQADLLSKEDSARYILHFENQFELVEPFLKKAICLQDAVYNIFLSLSQGISPNRQNVRIINEYIKDSYRHLTINGTEMGFVWQWENKETLDTCLWPIVQSAAELLTSRLLSRVRLCPGERCGWIFLDTSKNRSRKWCDMRDCGNTAKARTYRKRQNTIRNNDNGGVS